MFGWNANRVPFAGPSTKPDRDTVRYADLGGNDQGNLRGILGMRNNSEQLRASARCLLGRSSFMRLFGRANVHGHSLEGRRLQELLGLFPKFPGAASRATVKAHQ